MKRLIRACEADAALCPDDYTLRCLGGLSAADLRELAPAEYDRLREFREHRFISMAVENPRLATFAVYALRQGKYGAWNEKPAPPAPAVEITLDPALQAAGE